MDEKNYADILSNAKQPGILPVYSESMLTLDSYVSSQLPEFLYRFRSCTENNIDAFWNDNLWLSAAKYMNDDYDARVYYNKTLLYTWLHNLYLDDSFLQHVQARLIENDIVKRSFFDRNNLSNVVKKAVEVIGEFRPDYHHYVSEKQRDVIKFACFSESISSDLMWGHYADNAKGFALSYHFDCNKIEAPLGGNEAIKGFGDLYPVLYSDKRLDATEHMKYLMLTKYFFDMLEIYDVNVSESQKNNVFTSNDTFMYEKISLIKSLEWAPEKEWRLFATTDSLEEMLASNIVLKIKPSQLFLGRRISPIHERILTDLAVSKNIPVFKMIIDEESPLYELKFIQLQ